MSPSHQKQTWLDRNVYLLGHYQTSAFSPCAESNGSLVSSGQAAARVRQQFNLVDKVRAPSFSMAPAISPSFVMAIPPNDSIFSPFQLSYVCNTTHQFFLRHNRAARKSKLKMQSAPVRRKSGGY
jgi:hypothetical protein